MDTGNLWFGGLTKDLAGWIASAFTVSAAIMTASNLGARLTGWGFAVFAFGSLAWIATGILADETSLIMTNGFLALVNLFGVWRWLGREARHERAADRVARKSAAADVTSLLPYSRLAGRPVTTSDGCKAGTVIDAVMQCHAGSLAYIVVDAPDEAGLGEHLRAIDARWLVLSAESVELEFSYAEFMALPPLAADRWPIAPGKA